MAVKDHMTEPMQLPVTYELDDNGEANGSAHPYCSLECQRSDLNNVPSPHSVESAGGEEVGDDSTVCECCAVILALLPERVIA